MLEAAGEDSPWYEVGTAKRKAGEPRMEKVTAFWLQEAGVDGFRLDAAEHIVEDGENQENTPANQGLAATASAARSLRRYISQYILPTNVPPTMLPSVTGIRFPIKPLRLR